MTNLAPIALFVYNRLEHTKKTVAALQKNELATESVLYIFSDGPKNEFDSKKIRELRQYLKNITGFKKIYIKESVDNKGCAKSIIDGVSGVVSKHGKIIVVEDDIVTSVSFLTYMNTMLEKYKNYKQIYSIGGYNLPKKLMKIPKSYNYDVYLNPRGNAWGWATWEEKWRGYDYQVKDYDLLLKDKKMQKAFNAGGDDMFNMLTDQMSGKIDTWDIQYSYHHFKNNAFCIFPIESLVNNIGMDNTGTHCGTSDKFRHEKLNTKEISKFKLIENIEVDPALMKSFRKNYNISKIKSVILKLTKNTFLYRFYKKVNKKT